MQIAQNEPRKRADLQRVLVVGAGGRENSLAWAIAKSPIITKVWVAPGNAGTEYLKGCKRVNIEESNVERISNFSSENSVDLIVIGPEIPLASGLADYLRNDGFNVFGPSKKGAQIEASKIWAKDLMKDAQIDTAKSWSAESEEQAIEILKAENRPLVVKANGLAAGKGVTVAETIEESIKAVRRAFDGRFGSSGERVILEERIEGPEVSIFALCDGEKYLLLPPAQDHKRLLEGDKGPNTGGMGAYAPAPLLGEEELFRIGGEIINKTLSALKKKGIDYRGVIYAGLMLTNCGPKVIEFNCRFGDPECQALMPLMGNEFVEILFACSKGSLVDAPKLSVSELCSACVVAAAKGYPENPRKNDRLKIEIQESETLQIFHAGTKSDANNNILTSGGRVLSVVSQGETFDKAFSNAYKGIKSIQFDGITYRKDIGHQVRSN
tara:strand:+ start:1761 stop:3077 length:1317 start_codon:yes stop_codon:yes gene_type:complete